MTPKRPYLLRAFYEWIVDNDMTPHLLVDASLDDVAVPRQHVKDGRIVLNVSPRAVQDFTMDNTAVSFSARFGGVVFYVYCPMASVLAVYSRETQDGATFPPEEYAGIQIAPPAEKKSTGPSLAVVSAVEADTDAVAEGSGTGSDTNDSAGASGQVTAAGDGDGDGTGGRGGKKKAPSRSRAALRVVK